MKAGTIKIITASIIVGMFVFLAFIIPDHLAEPEFHDCHDSSEPHEANCVICQFIRHTPLPESDAATDITPLFQSEWLPLVSDDAVFSASQLRSPFSRAPPLFEV